jgi:hypothetical protein
MSHRLVGTTRRITTTNPMLQKVGRISRLIVGFVNEFLELTFCDRISIHVEGLDIHTVSVVGTRRLESIKIREIRLQLLFMKKKKKKKKRCAN